MNEQVKSSIRKTVLQMLEDSTAKANIKKMVDKHVNKVHFIPIRYRIIGGVLQGLNIKFGNFIEKLIMNLVEIDPDINVIPASGKKSNCFLLPKQMLLLIHI